MSYFAELQALGLPISLKAVKVHLVFVHPGIKLKVSFHSAEKEEKQYDSAITYSKGILQVEVVCGREGMFYIWKNQFIEH